MTKSIWLIIGAMLVLAGLSGGIMWLLRDKFAPPPPPASNAQADYDALVKALGQDERVVAIELHDFITTASVKFGANDEVLRGQLGSTADAKELLKLEAMKDFLSKTAKGENVAYFFIAPEKQKHLKYIVGDKPSAATVIALRNELVKLALAFAKLRQPEEKWSIKAEVAKGELPPPMPFLDMLRTATNFLPPTSQPVMLEDPKIGVFSAADADLLLQLEVYFNLQPARTAFPHERFPNLYYEGRILPIPRALLEYRQQIVQGMNAERSFLYATDNPAKEQIEAIDSIYGILERFFIAIEGVKLPE